MSKVPKEALVQKMNQLKLDISALIGKFEDETGYGITNFTMRRFTLRVVDIHDAWYDINFEAEDVPQRNV